MKHYDPETMRDPQSIRDGATLLSKGAGNDPTEPNGDERSPYVFSFTKGLAHGLNGLLADPRDFEAFVAGTLSHDPMAFEAVPAFREPFLTDLANDHPECDGQHPWRQWESPTAGHAYDLQGPDAQAIPMPPAPAAGSAEFAAEIAEVYQMALARDWPVASLMAPALIGGLVTAANPARAPARDTKQAIKDRNADAVAAAAELSEMRWFAGTTNSLDTGDVHAKKRRRFGQAQTVETLFRGLGEDAWDTPFLSQFMVMGTGGRKRDLEGRSSGTIAYGAQTIDQRVRVAVPGKDYMTTWPEFVDVQNGANMRTRVGRPREFTGTAPRHMATLRDLATYVHDDQLFQGYLNAALILANEGFAVDPGIPFHDGSALAQSRDNQEPFALFGGPHLLKLVTEMSVPALKAVRHQKFAEHRRLRPEAAGALFHTILTGYRPHREQGGTTFPLADGSVEASARRALGSTLAHYVDGPGASTRGTEPALLRILEKIAAHNAAQNGEDIGAHPELSKWLLPMAFIEGSPMHPSYGAGHATVAAACVTLLKAFFAMHEEGGTPVYLVKPGGQALVPGAPSSPDGPAEMLAVEMADGLTLEGELNKLMWNVSNGRNVAGVHYFTDYVESALLGEAITIGILREQMCCYHPKERVEMTVPLLVERTLPAALLGGTSTLSVHDKVKKIVIQSDGSLRRA